MSTLVTAPYLRVGDKFIVEPPKDESFTAIVRQHYGWGLVHGVMELVCERESDGMEFSYSIRYDTPVTLIGVSV